MVKHIVYIKGDVLKSDEHIIVHGCNCFNTMGSGIARQIRDQFPEAYIEDRKTQKGDRTKLGRFSSALCADGSVVIVNAYIQYRYGRDKVHVDYDALRTAMSRICVDLPDGVPIAMPKIGCGLAGGDWEKVSEILELVATKYNRTFHVYEL